MRAHGAAEIDAAAALDAPGQRRRSAARCRRARDTTSVATGRLAAEHLIDEHQRRTAPRARRGRSRAAPRRRRGRGPAACPRGTSASTVWRAMATAAARVPGGAGLAIRVDERTQAPRQRAPRRGRATDGLWCGRRGAAPGRSRRAARRPAGSRRRRGQAADGVVRVIDELAARLGVDAVGVTHRCGRGRRAAGARLDHVHVDAAPRQFEARRSSRRDRRRRRRRGREGGRTCEAERPIRRVCGDGSRAGPTARQHTAASALPMRTAREGRPRTGTTNPRRRAAARSRSTRRAAVDLVLRQAVALLDPTNELVTLPGDRCPDRRRSADPTSP